MASPEDGGRGNVAGTQGMKRCPHCGAKNKNSLEYCLRCSESLDDVAEWGGGGSSRSPMVAIMVAMIAAVGALVVLALVTSSANEEPQAAGATSPAPAMNIERPDGPILDEIDAPLATGKYSDAIAAFRQRDYDRAIPMFEDLARDLPDNPRVLQFLGLSYFHNGEFARSKQTLADAREIRPDSFELLDHYVTACKKDGDDESAFAALQDFVDRHPQELEARLELARIARATGDEDVAIEQTEYLATTREADPEFVYEYGVSLKNAGQLDDAKTVLRNSIELEPEAPLRRIMRSASPSSSRETPAVPSHLSSKPSRPLRTTATTTSASLRPTRSWTAFRNLWRPTKHMCSMRAPMTRAPLSCANSSSSRKKRSPSAKGNGRSELNL